MGKDIHDRLEPLIKVFRVYRVSRGHSAREVAARLGKSNTWVTEMETGGGSANPTLGRLADWAEALDIQEFGVYTLVDGHFTSIPLHIGEDDEEEAGSARQEP